MVERAPHSADLALEAIVDDLAGTQTRAADLLINLTSSFSRVKPGTWVGVVMQKDPQRSLVAIADSREPERATALDRFVASLDRPGVAPTSGFSQQVIESGVAMVVPFVSWDEYLALLYPVERDFLVANPPPTRGPLGFIIAPMRARNATIGTLGWFANGIAEPLAGDDVDWLQSLADKTAALLTNTQIAEDAALRLGRLDALQDVARAVASTSDLKLTLSIVLEHVTAQLEADAADVLLVDPADGMLALAAAGGFTSTAVPDYRLPVDERLPGRVLSSRKFEMSGPDFSSFRRRSLFAREGFKSISVAPMISGAKPFGVLEAFHRVDLRPDSEWIAFLEALAGEAAVAVEIAGLRSGAGTPSQASARRARRVLPPDVSNVEREILKLLVRGRTNREISEHVHLSESTVKFRVRQLLTKTGADNRTDLASLAMQEGWLE